MKKYLFISIVVLLWLFATGLMASPMTLIYETAYDGDSVEMCLNGDVNVTVDWGDGASEHITDYGFHSHTYANAGNHTVTISGELTGFGSNQHQSLTKILSFGDIGLIDLTNACANSSVVEVPNELPASVVVLDYMFYNCDTFNQNINSWDVSNVERMEGLFHGAEAFNQPLYSWDVSNVIDMSSMFSGAIAFNQDINSWDVSSVSTMEYMFYSAVAFNQNINSWNVSQVNDMRWMFWGAENFNQNLDQWDVSNVSRMNGMLTDVSLSRANYDALLIGWSSLNLKTYVTLDAGNNTCSDGDPLAARQHIIEAYNWTINDGVPPQAEPSVTTQYVTDETVNSANAHGKITYLGTSNVTQHGFCWSTTGFPTIFDSKLELGEVSYTGTFGASLTNLSPYTTYYLRAFVTNSAGTNYGEEVKFRTHDVYSTIPAIPIEINSYGGVTIPYHNLDNWSGMNPPCAVWDRNNFLNDPDNWFQTDSSEGTYWHNSAGGYGILVIDMHHVTSINQFRVFQGFYDGKTTGIQIYKNTEYLDSRQPLSFDSGWVPVTNIKTIGEGTNHEIDGYISNPTIITTADFDTRYIMFHVYNDGSIDNDNILIALKGIKAYHFSRDSYSINYLRGGDLADPTVYTEDVNNITMETADFTGNITDVGENYLIQKGACWNTTGDPTINDNKTEDGSSGGGTYHSSLTNLLPMTEYYVRAYATNSYGTSYGKTITFTTSSQTNSGNLYISEVCDNKTGENENTGFIELYNSDYSEISLDGYSIIKGTDDGSGFVSGSYSYSIPQGYSIPGRSFFVIGNGGSLSDINLAWLKSLTNTNYDSGNSSLEITEGYAYALNYNSKAIVEGTPEIQVNKRIIRKNNGNWATLTSTSGTPGEFGYDSTFPAALTSFDVIQNQDNFAKLNWTVQYELDLAGYNIYRNFSDDENTRTKITSTLIPAVNSPNETTYSYIDNSVQMSQTYYYWLESIDSDGNSQFFDPVNITIVNGGIPATGSGTEADPYLIANLDNLLWLSTHISVWDKYFKQTADIDASATSYWNLDGNGTYNGFSPIGNETNKFTGNYDGDNHTISNLYINRSLTDNVGLFGYINNLSGYVKNLILASADITGRNNTGALIGYKFGYDIENCHINLGTVKGEIVTGGLIGYYEGKNLTSCSVSNSVIGTICVGNLIGMTTSIYTTNTISNSYSNGNVKGITYSGGLIGDNNSMNISNCYSQSKIVRISGDNTVFGTFMGHNSGNITIQNCYSASQIFSSEGTIWGNADGLAADKGFIGAHNENDTEIYTNNFFDSEVSSQSTCLGATAKNTTEMKAQATFTDANWNFTANSGDWSIDSSNNSGYPYLQWQAFGSAPTAATNVFPANNSTDLPRTVTVSWRYSGSTLPTYFKVIQNGTQVGQAVEYTTNKLYHKQLNQIAWGSNVNWKIIPYNAQGNCASPTEWSFTVMAEPANTNEEPTEIVYEEIQNYTGTTPPQIVFPPINFGSGAVTPTIDLTFTSAVSNINIPIQMQDQPNTPLPNPANCGATLHFTIPNGNSTRTIFNFRGGFIPTELIHLNGTAWELVETEAHNVVFTEGQVAFDWISNRRGEEEFVVNKGNESTLPVELSSFTAIQTAENLAQIKWITQSETDILGYNIYRNITNEENSRIKITSVLIPAENSSNESNYSYIDNDVQISKKYYYWLESLDLDGSSQFFGPVNVTLGSGDPQNPDAPEITIVPGIQKIFPNPFNPQTTINYYLSKNADVIVKIYNTKGQKVNEFHQGIQKGEAMHSLIWNGKNKNSKDVSSGIYFINLNAGKIHQTRKAILLK